MTESDEGSFRDLIQRVRSGDAMAAEELVREYQDEIRRIVRVRLTDPRLRTEFESMDICQSVMGNFFVRVAGGQFDLNQPDDLLKLLATMAINKLKDRYRKMTADKRDHRVVRASDSCDPAALVPDPGRTPDSIVAEREMLERIRARLSEDERYVYEQRAAGMEWSDIVAAVALAPEPIRTRLAASTAESLRKKYQRALDRVLEQLGIDTSESD